jgi:DNA modification methylase
VPPYGSVRINEYASWFLPLADEFKPLLTPDGSFVLDIGGVWNKGEPTRSLYQYRLLLGLCEKVGFHYPFAGSNVTGESAERLRRQWIAIELVKEYLEGSKFRFEEPPLLRIMERPTGNRYGA